MTLTAEWQHVYPRWRAVLAASDEVADVVQQYRDVDGFLEVVHLRSWLLCTPIEDLSADQVQEQLQVVEEGVSRIAQRFLHIGKREEN